MANKTVKPSLIAFWAIILVSVLAVAGLFHFRLDLTQEKRYTLSDVSKKIIKDVKSPLVVDVYLEGDFPANFKQLQSETRFLLSQMKDLNRNIEYNFIDPVKTKMSQDTLMAMGMQPSVLPDMKDGKIEQIYIIPYAAVKYKGRGTSIPLVVEQAGIDGNEQITKSIENLEYNLVSAIKRITRQQKKNIGIIINHDELGPQEFQGFMEMALENYNAGPIVPSNQTELTAADLPLLNKMDALVVAKPRKPFSDIEKLILDQYIMRGGRMLWMIDAVNAEMDTLFRSKEIIAFPTDQNLTDFLFNYGVRINSGLVKDTQKAALIRIVAGEVGGNPQYNSFLWPYFPLGMSEASNPITKNLNPVKFEFPTAIDTLSRPGVKTTVLYESGPYTTLKQVPSKVALSEIIAADHNTVFEKPSAPKIFAVTLEGKFTSAYANRIERQNIQGFKAQSKPNKMVVIADGDVGRNQILKGKPLPLGADLLTKQQYGNAQFLKNTLDYLLDDANLMTLRNRTLQVRPLDGQKIMLEKTKWQWLNLLLPVVILALLAVLAHHLKKKRYTR